MVDSVLSTAWMADPTAWVGLATLVVLELILGIDNLIFIAILAQKLPPHQRDKARLIGLSLALLMRVVLLFSISWLAGLTEPVFVYGDKIFSWRDIILIVGGLFLLWKATMEIHGRLEGKGHRSPSGAYKAKFWMVVTQIIVLDAVFSLDAVITAVGMVEHVQVMVIAVTLAIVIMMLVSKALTTFVQKHPTIVMLCLGFLLMVGFSLVAEGFGANIPKGYLYAAIGFSLLVEMFNQTAMVKLKKRVKTNANVKQRTADAILKLLGAQTGDAGAEDMQEAGVVLQEAARGSVLSPVEKQMLRGVLNMSERPALTIMTPRKDVEFIDINDTTDSIFGFIRDSRRSHLLVVDGEIDRVVGLLLREDYLLSCLSTGKKDIDYNLLHEPVFAAHKATVMSLLETFRKKPIELVIVIDEHGGVEGVVTHLDVLEAIAGEFPQDDSPAMLDIRAGADGSLTVDGMMSVYDLFNRLGISETPDGRFATVAGLVLHELGRFPAAGDELTWKNWRIRVEKMDARRIDKVTLFPVAQNG
jgi:CBS domain containing-hemolysin-like protein